MLSARENLAEKMHKLQCIQSFVGAGTAADAVEAARKLHESAVRDKRELDMINKLLNNEQMMEQDEENANQSESNDLVLETENDV